jgi:hypothetical protein
MTITGLLLMHIANNDTSRILLFVQSIFSFLLAFLLPGFITKYAPRKKFLTSMLIVSFSIFLLGVFIHLLYWNVLFGSLIGLSLFGFREYILNVHRNQYTFWPIFKPNSPPK